MVQLRYKHRRRAHNRHSCTYVLKLTLGHFLLDIFLLRLYCVFESVFKVMRDAEELGTRKNWARCWRTQPILTVLPLSIPDAPDTAASS